MLVSGNPPTYTPPEPSGSSAGMNWVLAAAETVSPSAAQPLTRLPLASKCCRNRSTSTLAPSAQATYTPPLPSLQAVVPKGVSPAGAIRIPLVAHACARDTAGNSSAANTRIRRSRKRPMLTSSE
jgi:hypothetical protein